MAYPSGGGWTGGYVEGRLVLEGSSESELAVDRKVQMIADMA